MNSPPSIRWLVALRAEAKEIISQYELKSFEHEGPYQICLLYTSPSPRDKRQSRMPSSA